MFISEIGIAEFNAVVHIDNSRRKEHTVLISLDVVSVDGDGRRKSVAVYLYVFGSAAYDYGIAVDICYISSLYLHDESLIILTVAEFVLLRVHLVDTEAVGGAGEQVLLSLIHI